MRSLFEQSMKKPGKTEFRDGALTGLIFNVQPLSTHDGPGIRTLVFLKGCPLSCLWCSNPESQYHGYQWLYNHDACRADCGECFSDDVRTSITRLPGEPQVQGLPVRTGTDEAFERACPYGGLQVCGYEISVDTLVTVIENDRPFFGEAGGVTLSGGEPFMQPRFMAAFLRSCRRKGINTAIETCLYTPFERVEAVLPDINFFMFDLKLIDPEKHKAYCGVDNRLILENIRRLTRVARVPLLPRMPVIPGVNDDEENIRRTAEFMKSTDLAYLNLVPYMRLGVSKYPQAGYRYPLPDVEPPTEEDLHRLKERFYKLDIFCL